MEGFAHRNDVEDTHGGSMRLRGVERLQLGKKTVMGVRRENICDTSGVKRKDNVVTLRLVKTR